MHIKSRYVNEDCVLRLDRYQDGAPAIQLFSLNGEPLATATVSLAHWDVVPPKGHVYIKTWSENDGLLEGLEAAGVLIRTETEFSVNPYGSVAVLCKLNEEYL